MSEPLRHAPAEAPATEAEREALIEKLLLAGLDHYFDGSYEQAVNVWTRVAFLERGHGRARAYIERARGALAERQRHVDELLHRGIAAYDAGDLTTARELLTRTVAEGGANETAMVFLQRLGRVQPGRLPAPAPHGDPVRAPRRAMLPASSKGAAGWLSTLLVSGAIAAAVLLAAQPIASWLGERPVETPVPASSEAEPLPIVRASDARVAQARRLYEAGRLREALRLLDRVDRADPNRGVADRVKADIQRALLSAAINTPSQGEAAR